MWRLWSNAPLILPNVWISLWNCVLSLIWDRNMNREGGGQDRGQVRTANAFLNRLQPRGFKSGVRESNSDRVGVRNGSLCGRLISSRTSLTIQRHKWFYSLNFWIPLTFIIKQIVSFVCFARGCYVCDYLNIFIFRNVKIWMDTNN